MIPSGATIGILGGGQLGRMLAMAAAQLGYRCIGYAPEGDNVAADLCADFVTSGWGDQEALSNFGAQCDVITWEFENVPLSTVKALPEALMATNPRALEIAQDRLVEKRFVEQLGGKTAPYWPVSTPEDLADAAERIGTPGLLKTRRDGYDGKGQWRIASAQEVNGVRMPGVDAIYEGLVPFKAEFSVILARRADQQIAFWDTPENLHDGGILKQSTLPASDLIRAQQDEARAIASKIAESLQYVGVLTLEFFATEHGPVFNEMAPRVHNSGHWTIEGATTSQFENHIRAICGLPLGNCAMATGPGGKIEMRNLIGNQALEVADILADPQDSLHLYGKAQARVGRKMGHVTRIIR